MNRLSRLMFLFTTVGATVATASHPLPVTVLTQEQVCATPPCTVIPVGAFVAGTQVQVTATSDASTCGATSDVYKLDIEMRPMGTAFTGTPTHSTTMSKTSCSATAYPYIVMPLAPAQYHWQARESVNSSPSTWVQFNAGALAFQLGNPQHPELMVDQVNLSNMVSGASSLTFNVAADINNYGLTAANGFLWRVYLSTDRLKDASDVAVFTSPATNVAANSKVTVNGAVSISPKPAPGRYYVLVEADATNVVNECPPTGPCYGEQNNVGSTLNFFTSGTDLVATSVSGPTNSGPDSAIVVNAVYFNQGSDPAGNVEIKVLLSLNTTVDASDFTLYSTTKNITGGQTFNENLNITVPANVPGGDFYFLLQVDAAGAVTESDETNNVAVSSAKVTMRQADIVIDGVDFLDSITGAPTRVGNFGQSARLQVLANNAGGADAKNFKVTVVVSRDANLSLLTDTEVHDETVALLAAGQNLNLGFNFQLPLKDKAGNDFTTGTYYLFAIMDRFGSVTELNEQNNTMPVGNPAAPITLRAPAQDYVVSYLEAPAAAAVGEIVPVVRVIRNIGSVDGTAVKYRWYASANTIITPDDIPLSIVVGTQEQAFGTVTLAKGTDDSASELVRLPAMIPPASYYFGCIVDPTNEAAELDELNNYTASANRVQVIPAAFRVLTQQLPDGVTDRPYSFRLVATEPSGLTWTVAPGSGDLPAGLSLAPDGTISGTPTTAGITAFTVTASAGTRVAAARLALRILPTTSQLSVTTLSLPPIIFGPGIVYSASLGAAGGQMPYAWSVVGGALPNGIVLSTEGVLSGSPRPGVTMGESRITFAVTDALGSRAQALIRVRVVEPGGVTILTTSIPDSMAHAEYQSDLAAANGTPPYSWSLAAGSLPEGITLVQQGDDRGLLQGKPVLAGTYAFSVQVEDAKGRADVADYLMRIFPGRFYVKWANGAPAALTLGSSAELQLQAVGAGASAKFSLYSGRLPAGLELTPDGKITGTVSDDPATLGVHNFVASVTDTAGAGGLGAFSLEVVEKAKGAGCTTSGALAPAVAAALLLLRRRKR